MRADNLDSHDFPLAQLSVTALNGMPASITEGTSYHFTIDSQLTREEQTPARHVAGRRRRWPTGSSR